MVNTGSFTVPPGVICTSGHVNCKAITCEVHARKTVWFTNENLGLNFTFSWSNGRTADKTTSNRALFAYCVTLNRFFLTFTMLSMLLKGNMKSHKWHGLVGHWPCSASTLNRVKSNENYHNHELKQILLGKSRRVFQLPCHGKFTKQDRTKWHQIKIHLT